jgi:hypothetical protein
LLKRCTIDLLNEVSTTSGLTSVLFLIKVSIVRDLLVIAG